MDRSDKYKQDEDNRRKKEKKKERRWSDDLRDKLQRKSIEDQLRDAGVPGGRVR